MILYLEPTQRKHTYIQDALAVPACFWTTIAGSSTDSKALAFLPHSQLLRLALRVAPKIFLTANNLTQTPQLSITLRQLPRPRALICIAIFEKKKPERSLVRLLSFFKKTPPAVFCVRSTKRPQLCYRPATLSY